MFWHRFIPVGSAGRGVPRAFRFYVPILLIALTPSAHLHAVPAPAAAPAPAVVPAPLLPDALGGLRLSGPAVRQTGAAAATTDSAHAALLREDGLLETAQGSYGGAGVGPAAAPSLTVRAFRFGDATGAFAAFTAYRQPGMRREDLGAEGASQGKQYLFWTGATVVEATMNEPGLAGVDALRELARALPKPRGPEATPPPLPGYLPTAGLERETVHYAVGPAGYAAAGGLLPESVIEFSHDAEVAVAQYKTAGGTGRLTLLEYPTPQLAANREKAVNALLKSGTPPLTIGDPAVVADRVGPLVALTSGSFSAAEARAIVRSVHYDASITIDHPEGYISEVAKAAHLLLGIAYLTGVLAVSAVLLALFLGGGRVLIRRMRGKPLSSLNDDDFISLKLR